MKQRTTDTKTLHTLIGGKFAGILLALVVGVPAASSGTLEGDPSPGGWGTGAPDSFEATADTASGQESLSSNEVVCSLPIEPNVVIPNEAPVVLAGDDQVVTLSAGVVLRATISDDGLPVDPGVVSSAWFAVSGPGSVTFANATSAQTSASFSKAGTYVLRLAATDGDLSVSDELTVTVTQDSSANPAAPAPPSPRISNLALTPNGSQITWNTIPGLVYRLVYRDNLSDREWLPASLDVVAFGNELTLVDETAGLSARRFYAIVVVR